LAKAVEQAIATERGVHAPFPPKRAPNLAPNLATNVFTPTHAPRALEIETETDWNADAREFAVPRETAHDGIESTPIRGAPLGAATLLTAVDTVARIGLGPSFEGNESEHAGRAAAHANRRPARTLRDRWFSL
jgi:hypothetical protein